MSLPRCFCACHEFPGASFAEPCAYCKHFNSRGRMPGPVWQGWEPEEAVPGGARTGGTGEGE